MSRAKLTLVLILIVGVILRFYGLDKNPPSLNWDEVSHGYNAYSILNSGTDEWGQVLPIANFRAYGDYPLPLNLYLSMPGILLFGLNEWTARFPSAFFGSLLVLITYFLTKRFTTGDKLAPLAAFLVAISPWTVLTSRQLLQATPAIFFLALGILLFLKGLSSKKYLLFLGIISMGLSVVAYHNTRILAPVIFVLLVFLYRRTLIKLKNLFIFLLVLAAIFFVPLAQVITSSEGSARAVWVGILNQGAVNDINQYRSTVTLPSPIPELIYNKPTYFITKAATNYLGYFSPYYLGIQGGTHYQFSIPDFGIMYKFSLPFFYLGIFFLLVNFKRNDLSKKFLLIWLLLAPIPAAVTRDPYQVVRSTTMLPAIFIVTAFGVGTLLNLLKTKVWQNIFWVIFLISIIFSFGVYLNNLWFIYPRQYSFAWQYGYKQAVNFISQNQDKYSKIYITKKYGEPHEFLLFYMKYDPEKYKNDPNLVRYFRSDWYWVDSFDKFVFVNDWEIKKNVQCTMYNVQCLLITSPGNYQDGRLIKTINFLDGSAAFDLVELQSVQ